MKNCEIPGTFEDTLSTLLRANDLPAIKLGGITPPILTSLLPISADVPPPHSADVPPETSSSLRLLLVRRPNKISLLNN